MRRRLLCLLLAAALLLPLAACGGGTVSGYRIVDTYSQDGSFVIAFRQGDVLCEIVTAVMQELAANGTLRSASLTWFGEDIVATRGEAGAMDELWGLVEPRTLIVGVNVNNMPFCYAEGDDYHGFDVDIANYICGYLGWSMILRPIGTDDVGVQLVSGNIDCAMGQPQAEIGSSYSCSPAYVSGRYILVASLASGIRSRGGVRKKTLGVVLADQDILEEDEKFVAGLGSIIYQTGTGSLFGALDSGQVDAILVSSAMASYYMR